MGDADSRSKSDRRASLTVGVSHNSNCVPLCFRALSGIVLEVARGGYVVEQTVFVGCEGIVCEETRQGK